MKTRLSFSLLLFSLAFYTGICQVPQGFNYQAIARDGSGNPLTTATLQVRFSIQSSSSGGTVFWQELHASVTTNSFGMFTLVIGTGTRQKPPSTVDSFSAIKWDGTPKYLKTEIYPVGG
nr:hypothetical protein [Bacteroidales bacterium]